MKALVTGSEGFIGKHLCNKLKEKKIDVTEMDYKLSDWHDIRETGNAKRMIQYFTPDVIFHLAASTTVKYEGANSIFMTKNNVDGTHNLLEFAPRGCRFIFVSSVHCEQSKSVYAASKIAGESLVHAYTDMGLVRGDVLRLTSCVGKNMTHGVVKDFMYKVKNSGSQFLEVIGVKPGGYRPFVHVEDVVNALYLFGIERYSTHNNGIFNIVTQPCTIEEVALEVANTMGICKEIKWLGKDSKWLGDVEHITIKDSYNGARLHGWRPKYTTSLEAIRQAVKDNL